MVAPAPAAEPPAPDAQPAPVAVPAAAAEQEAAAGWLMPALPAAEGDAADEDLLLDAPGLASLLQEDLELPELPAQLPAHFLPTPTSSNTACRPLGAALLLGDSAAAWAASSASSTLPSSAASAGAAAAAALPLPLPLPLAARGASLLRTGILGAAAALPLAAAGLLLAAAGLPLAAAPLPLPAFLPPVPWRDERRVWAHD